MEEHNFWGEVDEDYIGFLSSKTFNIPYFDKSDVKIYLDNEFNGEETGELPSQEQLDEYKQTFSNFINYLDKIIIEISQKTFERYLKLYAHYYEDRSKSGAEPLNIDTSEKHFEYIKNIVYIRVLDQKTIKIPIRYSLDTEHGLEIKLQDNKIVAIDGIAET